MSFPAIDMRMADQTLQVKRLILEKQRLGVGMRIPRIFLDSLTVEQQQNRLAEEVVYRFEALVAAKTTSDTQKSSKVVAKVYVPETWWDHVKQRFAPAWHLKRWPVEYRTIETVIHETTTTTTTKMCPHVNVPENEREHFEWLSYEP